jgi:O-antigen/teichoic acid export membrane protein
MEKDTRDIARGAAVNFAGTLLRAISVIFYVYLARSYGPAVVGVFAVCVSTLDIVSKLGILGFDRAIMTMAARRGDDGDEARFYRVTAQGLLMAGLAAATVTLLLEAAAIPFSARLLGRTDLIAPLRIMAPGVFFWTLSGVLLAASKATRIMKHDLTVKGAVEPLVLFAGALAFGSFIPGVQALAWAFVVSTLAGAVAAALLFGRRFSFARLAARTGGSEERAEIALHAVPIGIYDLLNLLLQRVDLFILTRFAPAATVGVYAMAQNAAFIFKRVRQGFDPISLPVIAAAMYARRREDLLGHYRTVTRWVLIISLGMMGVAAVGSRIIMGIFGEDFTSGAIPLVILTAAIVVNTILGVSELFILTDRPILNVANTVAALGAAAVLGFLLTPRFGMVGAAAAMFGAYALMNVLRLVQVHALYGMHPFSAYHARAFAAFIGGGVAAHLLRIALNGLPPGVVDGLGALVFLLAYAWALALLGLAAEEKAIASRLLQSIGLPSRGRA